MAKCCRLVALSCNSTLKPAAHGHFLFTNPGRLESAPTLKKCPVVDLGRRMQTGLTFKKPISTGKFHSHSLKRKKKSSGKENPLAINVLCFVAQLSPILCNSADCRSPGSSARGESPGQNTAVGCHALLTAVNRETQMKTTRPGLPWRLRGKESAFQCRRHGFNS